MRRAPKAPRFSLLFVQDDEAVARAATTFFEQRDIVVVGAVDGTQAMDCLSGAPFDVVVLDLSPPAHDVVSVCQAIRTRSDVPVLIWSARNAEVDRIRGLEGGADDYIDRSVSLRELLARIRAHARRRRGLLKPREDVLHVGPLALDARAMSATLRGRALSLTAYEFALLRALAEVPGHVMSRDELLERATGSSSDAFDRSIDVRISRLRQKLGDKPRAPKLLKTIRGVGYKLAAG